MHEWDQINPDNPNHFNLAKKMFDTWIAAIEAQTYSDADFLNRVKMQDIMKSLTTEYGVRPLELVRKRNYILATERRLVQDAQVDDIQVAEVSQTRDDEHIREVLGRLHMLTQVRKE